LFANDDEVDYVLDAVQFVAAEGWKFLPQVSGKQLYIYIFVLFPI
jgi:hypothetical protein